MHKKDQKNERNRIMTSLQKRTALQYQRKAGIPTFSPDLNEHIPLYEKALQISITVTSLWGQKRQFTNQTVIMTYRLPCISYKEKMTIGAILLSSQKLMLCSVKVIIAKTVIRCSIILNCTDAMYGVTFTAGVNVYLAKKP